MINVISSLMKLDYRLISQKQEPLSKGGNFITVVAEAPADRSQQQILEDLSEIEGGSIVKLTFADSANKKTAAKPAVKPNIQVEDEETALQKMGAAYPDISDIVLAYGSTLDDGEREAKLKSLGQRVGAGVYKRDYSLGSPLKLTASLTRELTPALKQFCDTSVNENSVKLSGNPFCASSNPDHSCCDFVVGFINGFLSSNQAVKDVLVQEVSCGSGSSQKCTFGIIKS